MKTLEKYHPLFIFLANLGISFSGITNTIVSVSSLALSFAYLAYSQHLENNKLPDIRKETEDRLSAFEKSTIEAIQLAHSHMETKISDVQREHVAIKQSVQTVVGLKSDNIANLKF